MAKPLGDGARVVNHIPLTVTPDTSITHIASLMLNGRIHRIIVLEPAKLPAILVTTFDLSEVVSH
jgi:CBS domain-containing protein